MYFFLNDHSGRVYVNFLNTISVTGTTFNVYNVSSALFMTIRIQEFL